MKEVVLFSYVIAMWAALGGIILLLVDHAGHLHAWLRSAPACKAEFCWWDAHHA